MVSKVSKNKKKLLFLISALSFFVFGILVSALGPRPDAAASTKAV